MTLSAALPSHDPSLPAGYFVEHIGDAWQSVFPHRESEKCALHDTQIAALDYMVTDCGVPREAIVVLRRIRHRFWPSH